MPKKPRLNQKMQDWITARKRHRLSHAHVQMARELGMNPKKMGKLDNHDQEPWKAPLKVFIEDLYWEHFGKERPDEVMTIEEIAQRKLEKKAQRREERRLRREREAVGQASHAPVDEGTRENDGARTTEEA